MDKFYQFSENDLKYLASLSYEELPKNLQDLIMMDNFRDNR